MLERLEFTFSRLLHMLFKDCRRLFNFNLYYLFIAALFNILVHFVIYYISWRFFLPETHSGDSFYIDILNSPSLSVALQGSYYLVFVISLFPYVLFLRHISVSTDMDNSHVRSFNREVLPAAWQTVALVSFIAATSYMILNLVTWGDLQDPSTRDIFFRSEFAEDAPVKYWNRTLSWLNGLITEILPVLFLFLPFAMLLRQDYILDRDTFKQFRLGIITVLIMGYILNALTNDISFLLDTVAGNLFKIPFRDPVGGQILLLAARLVVIVFVLPLSAGMIVFPYEYELKQEPETQPGDAEPLPTTE